MKAAKTQKSNSSLVNIYSSVLILLIIHNHAPDVKYHLERVTHFLYPSLIGVMGHRMGLPLVGLGIMIDCTLKLTNELPI